MQKIYTNPNLPFVQHLCSYLQLSGISCTLKNEFLQGASGEMPLNEIWPEIWVVDENQLAEAQALLDQVLSTESSEGPSWNCSSCGEAIEAQFTECWKCGKSRESSK